MEEPAVARQGYFASAIDALLDDDAYTLDTDRIKAAVVVARQVKMWMVQNVAETKFFQEQLLKHMKQCFCDGVAGTSRKEKVWAQYHKLRSSEGYKKFWKSFLTIVGNIADDPAFYQYISHHIFKSYLKDSFPLPETPNTSSTSDATLTYEESNAVRYVAGYVCSKLYKKLRSSSECIRRGDLFHGIEDMIEDEDDGIDTSTEWLNIVDRGGLFRVNDSTYGFFTSIETVIRSQFQVKKVRELEAGIKSELVEKIVEDKDVNLQWSLIGIELGEQDKATLLRMIAVLWVTVRGFSFAGAYMELYKQASKQALQKSKALRSKLKLAKEKEKRDSQDNIKP